jgi:hypothetical protein
MVTKPAIPPLLVRETSPTATTGSEVVVVVPVVPVVSVVPAPQLARNSNGATAKDLTGIAAEVYGEPAPTSRFRFDIQ